MIRTLSLAVLTAMMLCSQASADFIIDDFQQLDLSNDGNATLVHAAGGGNIFLEVTSTGAADAVDGGGGTYVVSGGAANDTVTFLYTWDTATFNDLQSVSGNQLPAVPFGYVGSWSLDVDTGVGTTNFAVAPLGLFGTPIELDDATQLELTFTFNGGLNFAQYGGLANPLIATPEPTAALMLGSALCFGMVRRRRS